MKREKFIEFIKNTKGKCLDIGCGKGRVGREIMKINSNINCYGIDRDSSLNKEKYEKVRQGDLLNIPEIIGDTEKFNLIIGFHILEHIPLNNLDKVVYNLDSVLERGGIIIIETPHPITKYVPKTLGFNFRGDPTHVKPYTANQIEKIFAHKGYETLYKGFDQGQFIEMGESTKSLNPIKRSLYKLGIMKGVGVRVGKKK